MVGTRLGPFDIRERVDIPGVPEVYAARDSQHERDVFIHVLRTSNAHDEAVRDEFEQDVRAAGARIQHQPLTIHLIGVDTKAVYVVSDPVQVPPVAPAVAAEAPERRAARVPRGGWVAAVIFVAAIAAGMFATLPSPATPPPAAPVPEQPLVLPGSPTDAVRSDPQPRVDAEPRSADLPAAAPVAPASSPAPVTAPPPPPVSPAPAAPAPAADSRSAATLVTEATVRATEFDLEGALALLDAAAGRGDPVARIGMRYLRGVIAARDAFRSGGSGDTLKPVQESMAALNEIAEGRPGAAEIARLMLQAAIAAAQSERDEMRLYIDSAVQMEALQHAAGQGGAPLLPAGELAGDLWLQVHGYDDARRAYTEAGERSGPTLRIMSGLARVARRLNEMPAACAAYRRLLDTWGARPGLPVEIAEARAYVGGCAQ